MKKQIHVYYSGRVQGVGFRFTVEDIAKNLGVCGWVKNLHNGQVEIVAEAQEKALNEFLEKIQNYFSSYIQDTQVNWLVATESFKNFDIAFH